MQEVRPFSFRDRRFHELCGRLAVPSQADLIRAGDALAEVEKNGIDLEQARIPAEELLAAKHAVPDAFHTALLLTLVNLRKFHEFQRKQGYVHDDGDGVRLVRRIRPLSRIGIVCHRADCAALLMCAVPAQVAGVGRIAVAVEADEDGKVDACFLAAAKVLGIEEVYRLRGETAVAAFALTPDRDKRVDKIVGPGGPGAEAAKRMVDGLVGVDGWNSLAELAVVADSGANAKFIAYDFLARAEIAAEGEAFVLLATDRLLAEAVRIEINRLADYLDNGRRLPEILDRQGCLFVCANADEAVRAANALAPARLGLLTRDNDSLLPEVENTGLIYLGNWSAEAAGFGFSGANALVQPGRRSRYASGLGVDDFLQAMTVVEYSQERLALTGRHMMEMAESNRRRAGTAALRDRLELLRMASE